MKYSKFIFSHRSLFNRRLNNPNKIFQVPAVYKNKPPQVATKLRAKSIRSLDICCRGNNNLDIIKRINVTFAVWRKINWLCMLHCCLWRHTLCCWLRGRDVTKKHSIPLFFLVFPISSSFHVRRSNHLTSASSRCRGSSATLPPQRRWCPDYHWGQAPPSVNKTKLICKSTLLFNSIPDHY